MNISYWPLYSTRDKEKRTKWLLWERDRLNFGSRLGRHWIHSWGIYSQASDGWGDIKFFPTEWNFQNIISLFIVFSESKLIGEHLSRLLNTKCTLNLSNWPLYSRQRKKDKVTAIRKASLWLLAGNPLNSFLKD